MTETIVRDTIECGEGRFVVEYGERNFSVEFIPPYGCVNVPGRIVIPWHQIQKYMPQNGQTSGT